MLDYIPNYISLSSWLESIRRCPGVEGAKPAWSRRKENTGDEPVKPSPEN